MLLRMRHSLFLLLFLFTIQQLLAQVPVRFGEREVYLESNVSLPLQTRSTSSLVLGIPTGERLNVLVQFAADVAETDVLRTKGIHLNDYLGSNAYYAEIPAGSAPTDFVGTGIRAVASIRGDWKMVGSLCQNNPPQWAIKGDKLRLLLSWFRTVEWSYIQSVLDAKGIAYSAPSSFFRCVQIEATLEQARALADLEGVAQIRWARPPQELLNREGRRLSGGAVLAQPIELAGRGLTGKGVRIGIWDGNVGDHVDYGNRIHRLEYEVSVLSTGAHGMHTTGTIIGSGLLDERARGVAPEAEIWTRNFNRQSNGKSEEEEMRELYFQEHISLTSNSYGVRFTDICGMEHLFSYTTLGHQDLDVLAYYVPQLTHVYSAGNDQGGCRKLFSHATNYNKNIISVAAVNQFGAMTDFSSFGPLLDGRIFPIISARGEAVYSTLDQQNYKQMNGTSMSCPMVTGHLALLTQRWSQLHGGAVPYSYFLKALIANTADEAGNPGPDYKYGFGILNSVAAIEAMEQNWYRLDELKKGGAEQTFNIEIPQGVAQLRVALCWNDPVAVKEYKSGETPIVNDLDLTVVANGQTYFPYTLDGATPDANAVATKKNAVDNIEQVVLFNPTAGTYTLKVGDVVHQEEKQPYAVVWYLDYATPTMTAPLLGDVYSPNESVYFRTANMVAPVRIELSTDAGQHYIELGSVKPCDVVTLPADLTPSSAAQIRATDAQGKVLTSGLFTVMPQVQNVRLHDNACTDEGWTLTWESAPGAARYEILRANLQKESYEKVADLSSSSTEYTIPKEQIMSTRNIYAVRAISAAGVAGRRSVAALASAPVAVEVATTDLPYRETFVAWNYRNATVHTGSALKFSQQSTPVRQGLPLGSQMFVWQGERAAKNWAKPFANTEQVGGMEVCQLDLTRLSKGTRLQFLLSAYMSRQAEVGDTRMRLLVNGVEVPDVQGRKQIEGDATTHLYAWDFAPYAGQKVRVTIEFALRNVNDAGVLFYYKLEETNPNADVSLTWVNYPAIKEKTNMTSEVINFMMHNHSGREQKNLSYSITVDDAVVHSGVVPQMQPYEDRVIEYRHDFAAEKPRKFKVRVRVDVDNDADRSNNTGSFEVYNMGDIIAMPEVTWEKWNGQNYPDIPYKTIVLEKDRQLFTDGQGLLQAYHTDEIAVLQILPRDPKRALQVTFLEYDLADGDTLSVCTGNVRTDLRIQKKDSKALLLGKSRTPRSFVSEATNGGITFRLDGHNEQPGSGWVAEIREVPVANQWTLKSLSTAPGADANHKKLQVVVENRQPTPFHDVTLDLTKGEKSERLLIPFLKESSETVYVLPGDEIDLTAPMYLDVTAALARDGNVEDNKQILHLKTDPYWVGGRITDPEELYISRVRLVGGESLNLTAEKRLTYRHEKPFTLYTHSDNKFVFTLPKYPQAQHLPASIRVWIDLNQDNAWAESSPEMAQIPLELDQDDYRVNLDLSSLSSTATGLRRLRLVLAADNDQKALVDGKEVPWGQIVDLLVDIKEGKSPSEYELALLALEAPKTARNLGTSTLSVRVKNNGLKEQNRVKLGYKVDAGSEVVEELPCVLPAYGGQAVVTFTTPVDMSAKGEHEVLVRLVEPDVNLKDNELRASVYNIPPKQNKIFGLKYHGVAGDELTIPISKTVNGNLTLEGWWKLDKTQHCALLAGDKVELQAAANVNIAVDNALVVIVDDATYVTEVPVFVPGKWQHIAVTLTEETESGLFTITTPRAYIDGEEIPLTQRGIGYASFQDLHLNILLAGQQAMFRVWERVRTQTEISATRLTSVRNATGVLPAGCLGEYIFTEGEGAVAAFGDEVALLRRKNLDQAWQPLNDLVRSVTVEGQSLATERLADNLFSITMPEDFSAFDKVALSFELGWEGTQVLFNNTPIQKGQTFDFGTEHKLTFSIRHAGLWGVPLEQEVKVQLEKDRSNACDLLGITMLKTENEGLKEDLSFVKPNQTIRFVAAEETNKHLDLTQIKLRVTDLSPQATFYVERHIVEKTTPFLLDLRTPKVLKVESENKRHTKYYTVQLAMSQEIVWESTPLTRVFTNITLQLTAVASSKLPVHYYSLNPAVATVDASGHLITAGVGTTTIVATQAGNAQYAPALAQERQVTVTPAPLTIKVKNLTMEAGDELPDIDLLYDGLQFADTEQSLDAPYAIWQNGEAWQPTMPALNPGEYDIVPLGYTAPYAKDNYIVTREKGKLTVLPATQAQQITWIVNDDEAHSLAGATLQCADVRAVTNEQGSVASYLMPGRYKVTASLTGYTTAEQDVEIAQRERTITLHLHKKRYTLTYLADEHGRIQGETEQWVAEGETGSPVVAVPLDSTYRFAGWEDDFPSALRRDSRVHHNLSVKAEFERVTYTLRYEVGDGGEVLEGSPLQTVEVGGEGKPITVRAKAGYLFVGWSDGVKEPTRIASHVVADLSVKAVFVKPYLLSWYEDFELGKETLKDWTFAKPHVASHRGWIYADKNAILTDPSVSGKALMIDPKGDNSFSYYSDCWATTPWLSLEGRDAAAKLEMRYTYAYHQNKSNTVLEYSFEDGVWHKGEELSEAMVETTRTFAVGEPLLQGHKYIRFRWKFSNKRFSTYVVLDDIVVRFAPQPAAQVIARYWAGEHGRLLTETGIKATVLELKTTRGVAAPKVRAEAFEGYRFEKWSDGLTTAERQDANEVNVKALFKKIDLPSYTVEYVARPNGRIEGLAYQEVQQGKSSSPVIALSDAAFRFAMWSDNRVDNPRTDVVTENISIEAIFEPIPLMYTLTYTSDGGGMLMGNTLQEVENGKNGTTVAAVAYEGYKFAKWDDNVLTATRTETAVSATKTYKALFVAAETYAVELDCIGQGELQIQGYTAEQLKSVVKDTPLTVEVTPAVGWKLVQLRAGNEDILQDKSFVVKAHTKVQARWVQQCEIKLTKEGEGELSVVGYNAETLKTVEAGTQLKIEAKPAIGWKLTKLMAGRRNILPDQLFTVHSAVEVKATFEKIGTPNSVDNDSALAEVIVAPNPFMSLLRITGYEGREAHYEIVDIQGRAWGSGRLQSGETIIDTTELPAGIYLLRLLTQDETSTLRILKE